MCYNSQNSNTFLMKYSDIKSDHLQPQTTVYLLEDIYSTTSNLNTEKCE